MDSKDVRRLNRELAKLSDGRTTLQDFLNKASALDPVVAKALEGIYCGVCDSKDESQSARSHQALEGTKYFITFGWYADPNRPGAKPRVEFAYISA